ncbi:MAG: glycosyltransferase family 39 protein [Patescibacteria group bacterium]|jgi:hypothetical protein
MASETRRDLLILGVAGLVFLISTQILSFVGSTFVSPDETANAFFSETFSVQGHLYSFEPFNSVLGDFFYPRGTVAVDGRLLPIGFLGLPLLFGMLIKIFGFWSTTFWTPLFSFLAVVAWYTLWTKIFDRRIGLFSALLLLVTPAWWYWSGRPLMPNVLLVSFLIFSLYFLVTRPCLKIFSNNRWGDFLLAGLTFGGALWIRTSEIFWLGPILFLAWVVARKKVSWSTIAAFGLGLFVVVLPLLFVNKAMYGNYFVTGYTVASPSIVTFSAPANNNVAVEQSWLMTARDHLSVYLPFGLHPRAMWHNVWNYGLLMFWWLTIPALVGAGLLLWQEKTRRRFLWPLLGLFLTAAILVIVYGSSAIHDNPDLSAITIGNSYSRYWLPLFVAITPLVAVVLTKLAEKTKKFIPVVCFLAILALSINIVFFSSVDALWPTRERLIEAEVVRERVLTLTEDNAVIVTERGDKLFFPDRVIRYYLRDETTYALLPQIITIAPLYYYGVTLPQIDLDYLNNQKLAAAKLRIDLVETLGSESLYRFTLLP